MIKQIFTLIFMISLMYSCKSNTGNSEASEKNVSVNQADSSTIQEKVVEEYMSVTQAESNAIQENVVEEHYIDDYSDQYMGVAHYPDPVKLSTDESEKVFDFFNNNIGNQIPSEIVRLFKVKELSESEFSNERKLYASDFYQSENIALLFIEMTTYVGRNLTVLCILNDMIVSKIYGITLNADSDGNYSISGKYEKSGALIFFHITEEEYFLNESGINNYVIEYLESNVHYYEFAPDDNGIFQQYNYGEDKSFKYVNTETLEGWSKEDLRKLRNYIFAKHSYIFKSQDLSEYFKQFDWYEAKYANVDDKLSDPDKEFVRIVKAIEDNK